MAAAALLAAALPGAGGAQEPRLLRAARLPPAAAAGWGAVFDASRPLTGGELPVRAASAARPEPPVRRKEPRPQAPRAAELHQALVVPVPEASAAYKRSFSAMLARPDRTDRWDGLILSAARRHRVDARLIKAVMAAESEFDPDAVSPAGARGLMQVMPATAERLGVPARRLSEAAWGLKAGAAYLRTLLETAWRLFRLHGLPYTEAPDWVLQRVVAAYHAGPKALVRARWHRSTRDYVRKVLLFYRSKVTDLRRPEPGRPAPPSFADFVAPSGLLH